MHNQQKRTEKKILHQQLFGGLYSNLSESIFYSIFLSANQQTTVMMHLVAVYHVRSRYSHVFWYVCKCALACVNMCSGMYALHMCNAKASLHMCRSICAHKLRHVCTFSLACIIKLCLGMYQHVQKHVYSCSNMCLHVPRHVCTHSKHMSPSLDLEFLRLCEQKDVERLKSFVN